MREKKHKDRKMKRKHNKILSLETEEATNIPYSSPAFALTDRNMDHSIVTKLQYFNSIVNNIVKFQNMVNNSLANIVHHIVKFDNIFDNIVTTKSADVV